MFYSRQQIETVIYSVFCLFNFLNIRLFIQFSERLLFSIYRKPFKFSHILNNLFLFIFGMLFACEIASFYSVGIYKYKQVQSIVRPASESRTANFC